ncbi:transcobalamin-2-like [Pecten maximus]|uniref:transcobalamin-2-like n=1 Tax=Pecten maximus TaxID=6579 RepID=UPI0014589FDC|nr:transcobalamin-2-like [Pecten maximus]
MASQQEGGPHSVRKELTLHPSVLKAIIKESVQVLLSETRKWSEDRLDTAETVIGITLGYPEVGEEFHSAYSAILADMNIDIQAALISDSGLSNTKWERGKLAQYICGILGSRQQETATSYYGTTNLLDIIQKQLHDEKEYFCKNRFALAWVAIAMHKNSMDFEQQFEDILTAHQGTYKYGIDEAAMITMACTCLNTATSLPAAHVAAETIAKEIQKENNTLNEYSLGLAAQALVSTKNKAYVDQIARAKMGIVSKIEIPNIMKNGLAASQILPALSDKCFLDIGIIDDPKIPTEKAAKMIEIEITVETPFGPRRNWRMSVPEQPTLLHAMEVLQARAPSEFSFQTTTTSLEPMVSKINGMPGNQTNMYWRILLAPDTPLSKGVAETYPRNGERYIFQLTDSGTH